MMSRLITVVCIAVLCIILTLGLWPFHAPRNDVSWLGNRHGLRFGRFGTVFSADEFKSTVAQNPTSGSLEIWLQPRRIWDFATFLTFYIPGDSIQFSLGQAQTNLLMQAGIQGGRSLTDTKNVYVKDAFPMTGPVFITVTAGTSEATVYIDGIVAKNAPQVRFSSQPFTGRLVLGDSVEQGDSWSGQLLGVSIYNRELKATQVLNHYKTWTHEGSPQITGDDGNVALYLFDEGMGSVIHGDRGSDADLYIPEKYTVLDQMLLENPLSEFRRSRGYWGAVVKNIVGFIPLGACFYAYFCLVRRTKRAALATVIFGFGVSLTIEVPQAFIPTRDSGTTDLITNTLGTYIGVLSYIAVSPILARLLLWWPSVASRRP
jgi:VanZ family protein